MPKRVLIVEDDLALLRGLKDNFEAQGYEVQTATDGQKALEALAASEQKAKDKSVMAIAYKLGQIGAPKSPLLCSTGHTLRPSSPFRRWVTPGWEYIEVIWQSLICTA